MPYSGPASAYGVIGKTEAAYFKMINEQGGVNGRMINLVSLDDGYSPPKTVEQVRRLVEQEQVAFLFNTLGTAPNLAIREYCNENMVPQLYRLDRRQRVLRSRALQMDDGLQPQLSDRGAHLRQAHPCRRKPNGKIAVLYQNDGFGKDYLIGLKDGLGAEQRRHDRQGGVLRNLASRRSTVRSSRLQGSGADVLLIAATPKFAAQAIRKIYRSRLERRALRHQRLGCRSRRS